ncbi:hypothetical protein ACFTWS_39960 [Streptomyces sp. NPDC057027]|uniref:hypothetical protein n=1 Tax=Streptomyces sp. NPDC057027 TaxID=3346004 RepID=UPI00363B603C
MHPALSSGPPPTSQTPPNTPRKDGGGHRRTLHDALRTYLVLNGTSLVIGVVMSCSTRIAEVRVNARLTLGIMWGLLQLTLFMTTTWWYERQATRLPGPLDAFPQAGTSQDGW